MSVENSPSPDFLSEKYNLHKTPEVDKSVKKLRSEGEKIAETKDARIDAHFRRIDRALEHHPQLFTHLVQGNLAQDYTINLQNEDGSENEERVAELIQGLFDSEKEILRRRGMQAELDEYGDTPKPEDFEKYRQQIYDKKLEQEKTLSKWTEYLGSDEAQFYPTWFKYFALRSLQKMGKRDRDTESYSKRSANTLQPFPDLSYEAFSKTLDAIKEKEAGTLADPEKEYTEDEQAELDRLNNLIERADFAKLYAHYQGEIERAKRERKEGTAGEWIHYPSGSNAQELVKTLEGKGTEWCTAGLDVAKNQLERGEFYIYYTNDQIQKPVDPRVAIYLIDGQISEVRGIYGKDQDLELEFVDIAREKYKDFPGSENYEKKDRDMKQLSRIEDKVKQRQELDRDDLVFLYELDFKIEGFGHGADPRVAELRATRNASEDAPIVFGCRSQEIAHSQNEINENTKAYIGPLTPGIFTQLANIEHIYTSFPEGKIRRSELEIGGKTEQELEQEMQAKNIKLYDYAKDMMRSSDSTTSPNPEQIKTVHLKVSDLGFANVATTDQIYARAEELGLDLCPAEVGPYQRLKDIEQPLGDYYRIAMKQIADRSGYPGVFGLVRRSDGLWLGGGWALPTGVWGPGSSLMFRLR